MIKMAKVGHTKREKSDDNRKDAKTSFNQNVYEYIKSLEERIKILENLTL